jgi:tetratricopeptide (TPR) repeat protein
MARLYTKIPFKPEVSEEVRRFAVQADMAASNRQYAESAALYQRALNLAPWWPLGNYNAALTEAQAGLYADAIIHMNAFLAASPDAPNARTARDKIYEWEALAKKIR